MEILISSHRDEIHPLFCSLNMFLVLFLIFFQIRCATLATGIFFRMWNWDWLVADLESRSTLVSKGWPGLTSFILGWPGCQTWGTNVVANVWLQKRTVEQETNSMRLEREKRDGSWVGFDTCHPSQNVSSFRPRSRQISTWSIITPSHPPTFKNNRWWLADHLSRKAGYGLFMSFYIFLLRQSSNHVVQAVLPASQLASKHPICARGSQT